MYVDTGKGSLVRIIAGIFVIATIILGFTVSKTFFYVNAVVGFMLIFSALTGF